MGVSFGGCGPSLLSSVFVVGDCLRLESGFSVFFLPLASIVADHAVGHGVGREDEAMNTMVFDELMMLQVLRKGVWLIAT